MFRESRCIRGNSSTLLEYISRLSTHGIFTLSLSSLCIHLVTPVMTHLVPNRLVLELKEVSIVTPSLSTGR